MSRTEDDMCPPLRSGKQGSSVHPVAIVEKVARAIFRATFHVDEPEAVVAAKWEEWPESRQQSRRKARAALSSVQPSDWVAAANTTFPMTSASEEGGHKEIPHPQGDVEKVIARLRGFRSINEWGDPCHHTELDAIADQFASLLTASTEENKRLRAERDEWKRLCDDGGKVEVYWTQRAEKAEAQAEAMKAALEEAKAEKRLDDLHIDLLCSALAEIKATHDGDSTQPIGDILNGVIEEIKELKAAYASRSALSLIKGGESNGR